MKKVQSHLEAFFLRLNTWQSLIMDRLPETFFVEYSHYLMFGRKKDKKSKSPYSLPTLNSGKS